MNLGLLASHNGSTMQALIDACRSGRLGAKPVAVVSNNKESGALARARKADIPAFHLSGATHPDPAALDRAIAEILLRHDAELVALAGYMKKIGPAMLAAFPARIINIHPGLLPEYGGQGMYGKRVHEAVIASGAKETGATIHLVDAIYDHGPILAQSAIPVRPGETADRLAARVAEVERRLYVDAIDRIIRGAIRLEADPFSQTR